MRKNKIITISEKLEIFLNDHKDKYELPEITEYSFTDFSCGEFNYIYVSVDYAKNIKKESINWYSLDKIESKLNNEFDYTAIKYFWNNIEKFEKNTLVLNSIRFVKALIGRNIEEIKRIPKSDLHNHTPYGGSRKIIKEIVMEFSEKMQIFPELALDRNKHYDDLERIVIKFLDTGIFYSIDLTGDESLGVNRFEEAYSIASKYGIIKKAHVGEFSDANIMFDAITKLNLDVVQHGIAAEKNNELMKYIKERNISLTICPSSNYYLSRIDDIKTHPVKNLYHHNVNVSICSDDILIFDSDVSKEYLRLFEKNVLSAFELNMIRLYGLNFYAK